MLKKTKVLAAILASFIPMILHYLYVAPWLVSFNTSASFDFAVGLWVVCLYIIFIVAVSYRS
jgi:hypothetical protein